jgi:uncharacterized protein (TIGR02646 family)
MRPPDSFKDAVKNILSIEDWSEFKNPEKSDTAMYMLEKEQKYLCVYCERRINDFPKNCHFEHLKPRSIDKMHNTFDYSNLTLSCNSGTNEKLEGDTTYESITCGHKKREFFNEGKFLSPVELKNISDYFVFDFIDGSIESSEKKVESATYMIDLLNLNDAGLKIARRNALKNLRKYIQRNYKTNHERKNALIKILDATNKKQLVPYYTFLCYSFKDVLKQSE